MSLPFGPFPLETVMLGVTHGLWGGTLTSSDAAEYRNRNRIRPVGAPHGRGASSAGKGLPVDGAPGAVRNAGHP